MNIPFTYPAARTADQTDDYHGTSVADPYRWLEDPDTPESRAWIEAENALAFGFLEEIPARKQIQERLTTLWNYERYGTPYLQGGRYFYSKNDGLQNQSVLYVAETLEAVPRLLLDPNTLSADGTVALAGTTISEDGKLLAYGLSAAGSDWTEWHVRDIDTGEDRADHLRWIKFSGASWAKDGSGFYYSRYDAPKEGEELSQANYDQKLYFHALGTDQSDDVLIYARPDHKEWGFNGFVSEDGAYLIISVRQGTETKNRLFYKPLADASSPIVELIPELEAQYRFMGNDGPVFWFRTDNAAARGRVIAIDTDNPAPEHWREVIPEAAETLEGVSLVGERFIAAYLKDAYTQVKVFGLDGTFERDITLPGIGSAGGFGGKRDQAETFYSFTSYTTPTTIYRYDIPTGTSTLYRQPTVAFEPSDYETHQVFYASKDGTRIPLFLTHKKGLTLDGSNPTYLYGYGGFDISLTPSFSPAQLVWLEMGGILAVANLRGGGEYGEAWHEAGKKANKQNVFDDFIAAAEWLIAEKYTSTPKLAISGGSNGGLLVGACLTQRPDLFGACLPAVGVLDMLRFQKFTIGWAWVSDYGSADNAADFSYLYAYSPLHNLKPGTAYPPTLITTGDHDDRVVPAHSFKFAAALQAAQTGPAPILIRIETRAGHGAGKPTAKIIEEAADRWAFLVEVLGWRIRETDMDWNEFLHEAVAAEDIDLVRQALAQGADPNHPDDAWESAFAGTTELFWAVSHHVKIAQLLLESGARVAAGKRAHSSALHAAVEDNNLPMINLLLDYDGATALNKFDYIDRTPLMIAVEMGNVAMAHRLIEAGADVNTHNEPRIGDTALHTAAANGTLEMVKLLVCAGADPTIRGWMWITPLDKARGRKRGDGPRVYELLKQAAKKTHGWIIARGFIPLQLSPCNYPLTIWS